MVAYGPWNDPPIGEEHIWPGTYMEGAASGLYQGRYSDEVQTDGAAPSGWTFVRRNANSGSKVIHWQAVGAETTEPSTEAEARPGPSIAAWVEAAGNQPGFNNFGEEMYWSGRVFHDGSFNELLPFSPGWYTQHDIWYISMIEMWMAHIPTRPWYFPPESIWPEGAIDVEHETLPAPPVLLTMEVLPIVNLSPHYSVYIKKAGHGQATLPLRSTKWLGGESGFDTPVSGGTPTGSWDDLQAYAKVDDGYVFTAEEVAVLNTVTRPILPAVGSTHPDYPVFPRLALARNGMPPIEAEWIVADKEWTEISAPDITVRLTYSIGPRWRYVYEELPPEPPLPSIEGQQGAVRRRFGRT